MARWKNRKPSTKKLDPITIQAMLDNMKEPTKAEWTTIIGRQIPCTDTFEKPAPNPSKVETE